MANLDTMRSKTKTVDSDKVATVTAKTPGPRLSDCWSAMMMDQ